MVIQPNQSLQPAFGTTDSTPFIIGGEEELSITEHEMSYYFNYPLVIVAGLMDEVHRRPLPL
jgi:hypothetical protein